MTGKGVGTRFHNTNEGESALVRLCACARAWAQNLAMRCLPVSLSAVAACQCASCDSATTSVLYRAGWMLEFLEDAVALDPVP